MHYFITVKISFRNRLNLPSYLYLFLLLILVFAPGVFAISKQDSHHLLIMDSQTGEPYHSTRVAMLESLSQSGYVEGKNLKITYHSIGNDRDLGRKLLQEELARDYDVVFINGTLMALAAKDVSFGKNLQPFVYACVTDPVGVGVINSFNESPPANFTGVSYPVPVARRLDFVRTLLPEAGRIGLIYADMPQSQSYRRWLEDLLKNDPSFKDIEIIFRSVSLEKGEAGSRHMTSNAESFIHELDPLVDLFLSPNDQMGVMAPFAESVFQIATKPLIGVGRKDVTEGWGAAASIFPSLHSAGNQAAEMIRRLFKGESIENITPEWPAEFGFAFDLHKAQRFGLSIPESWLLEAKDNVVR